MKERIHKELILFDLLKVDYFDKHMVQLTLDYFFDLPFFEGTKTNDNCPSTTFISQSSLSPAFNLKCDTTHVGTVVRRESDLVDANCNVVLVNQSPIRGIELLPYKSTYPSTKSFKYPCPHIGIRIGRKMVSMTIQNPRQLRGLAILSSGLEAIKRVNENHYQVKSQHGDHYYEVVCKRGIGWTCSCPNWQEYQQPCKHVYATDFSIQLRLEVERDIDTDNVLTISEVVKCPECKSDTVVKNGQRKCKNGINQRYKCRNCGITFVVNKELSRIKATPEALSITMDLYFKGVSLAKIKHHLKMI